jgi:hypothetical protein
LLCGLLGETGRGSVVANESLETSGAANESFAAFAGASRPPGRDSRVVDLGAIGSRCGRRELKGPTLAGGVPAKSPGLAAPAQVEGHGALGERLE